MPFKQHHRATKATSKMYSFLFFVGLISFLGTCKEITFWPLDDVSYMDFNAALGQSEPRLGQIVTSRHTHVD